MEEKGYFKTFSALCHALVKQRADKFRETTEFPLIIER